MPDRTLVVSATNLLSRGFLVVPTDRKSRDGAPANGLYAVARAIPRAVASKTPARAVAVIDAGARNQPWPELLAAQLAPLPGLCAALGLHVVEAPDEVNLVASYAQAALDRGDDAIVVGVDKRYAQLVSERLWWYDANKDTRYTAEIVHKRFGVPPPQVAEWLALVGDEDALPGIAGLGAKGPTSLLATYGSIEGALAAIEGIKGRQGNALRAARDEIPRELARARLDTRRPLPVPLDALGYTPPAAAPLNRLYHELGFVELLMSEGASIRTVVCDTPASVAEALERLGSGPIAVQTLLDDPAPLRETLDCRYAKVREFQDEQLRLARRRGHIVTIAGRPWPIGGLESLDPHDRSYAERLARRATHEGSVADVARRALLDAERALRCAGLSAAPVHEIVDEVLFEVPEAELDAAARVAADAMRHAFELEVPLVVGVEAGPNWADLAPLRNDGR